MLSLLNQLRHKRWPIQHIRLLRGDPQRGNQIVLFNRTERPVVIHHFDVVWADRLFGIFYGVTHEAFSLEDEIVAIKIDPHSTEMLSFEGIDHFYWGHPLSKTYGELFLRIWLFDKKGPLWLKLS